MKDLKVPKSVSMSPAVFARLDAIGAKNRSRVIEFACNLLCSIAENDPRSKEIIRQLANGNYNPEIEAVRAIAAKAVHSIK